MYILTSSTLSTLAPLDNNNSATSSYPLYTAMCKGVSPLYNKKIIKVQHYIIIMSVHTLVLLRML